MDRNRPINVGDTVRHRAEYLKSTSWFTEVPINGLVKRVTFHAGVPAIVEVEWSQDAPATILAMHLEQAR